MKSRKGRPDPFFTSSNSDTDKTTKTHKIELCEMDSNVGEGRVKETSLLLYMVPPELLQKIFNFLDNNELAQLRMVNSIFCMNSRKISEQRAKKAREEAEKIFSDYLINPTLALDLALDNVNAAVDAMRRIINHAKNWIDSSASITQKQKKSASLISQLFEIMQYVTENNIVRFEKISRYRFEPYPTERFFIFAQTPVYKFITNGDVANFKEDVDSFIKNLPQNNIINGFYWVNQGIKKLADMQLHANKSTWVFIKREKEKEQILNLTKQCIHVFCNIVNEAKREFKQSLTLPQRTLVRP